MASPDLARFRADHASEAARAAFLARLGGTATPAAAAAAARALGYQVTEADFATPPGLTEAELDRVAGGARMDPRTILQSMWG